MFKYALKRVLMSLPVLIGVVTIVFTLMYVTDGDPAMSALGENATEEAIEIFHREHGLDNPYIVRLGSYILGLCRGDFGTSYKSGRPVIGEILARYPTTLKLALSSALLGLIIGSLFGVISAVKQYSIVDNICVVISLFGISAPIFWLAMMLVLIFSVTLKWLPPTGTYGFKYWIMPVFCLGMQSGAKIMRMTRSTMLEVIRQDYVRTAKAKGQTPLNVVMNHAFRNALIPLLTQTGIQICTQLAGSVMIESVFAMPGLGKYVIDSLSFKDYPAVTGGVLWIALNCVLVNLIIDLLYGLVDPRIRATYINRRKKATANG